VALDAQGGGAGGGEARIRLRSLAAAGPIVTMVGNLTYDTARLKVKNCEIGAAAAAGKALTWAEPKPGLVSTVVAGGLGELPAGGDVLSCTFAKVPSSPPGEAALRVEGDVADAQLAERRFVAETTVGVGN
jgi:hypothetical protein